MGIVWINRQYNVYGFQGGAFGANATEEETEIGSLDFAVRCQC